METVGNSASRNPFRLDALNSGEPVKLANAGWSRGRSGVAKDSTKAVSVAVHYSLPFRPGILQH
jgi:hypothetical protein